MKKFINQTAKILGIEPKKVENYTKVWGELYDFENTTPNEYAEMIQDIVNFY